VTADDHFLVQEFVLVRGSMHGANYTIARCPSVYPSVRPSHDGIVSKWLNISSNFF